MTLPFVLVDCAKQRRLLRVSDVREIVPMLELDCRDQVSGAHRGLFRLRGDVVPVIDLAGADAPLSASRLIVVLHSGGEDVGLVVDDVIDVVNLEESAIAVRTVGPGRTRSIAQHGGELVSILELSELS